MTTATTISGLFVSYQQYPDQIDKVNNRTFTTQLSNKLQLRVRYKYAAASITFPSLRNHQDILRPHLAIPSLSLYPDSDPNLIS